MRNKENNEDKKEIDKEREKSERVEGERDAKRRRVKG